MYSPQDSSYTIAFPARATAEQLTVPGADGPVTVDLVSADPSKSEDYSCMFFVRPKGDDRTLDTLLTDSRDGSMAKIQGVIGAQKRFTLDGNQVLETTGKARGDSQFVQRIIAVGNRVYMLMAVSTDGPPNQKTLQHWINSFRVLKK